ncbi:MAG: bifunctional 5,10-methylenetetrahydrofolate dehydrogenase/5,10-methenyltetrahydrofolate cyclohydrolase [Bacilli bacterium]|nr:bifunctional 5,10-methylenetetrahydrofolate dehydrogenase/5,10-methenyltetrahydrofolate cyclohydrolase [Bacilli bacterium]
MIKLYGTPVVDKMLKDINNKLNYLSKNNIIPKLAIVRLGENNDDILYEKSIIKNANSIGMQTDINVLPLNTEHKTLEELIIKLNNDKSIHGILIFNSLPINIDESKIKKIIKAEKDIDCISYNNIAKLFIGKEPDFIPCTVEAVIELLNFYNIDVEGKIITIIGRSEIVGKPLSIMLLNKNATVTICHSKTVNLIEECKKADILISSVGKANIITDKYINKDQIIIDIGINYLDGKICGDVNFDSVKDKIKMITPVPGGIGTITTTILIKNTIYNAYNLYINNR